MRPSCWAALAVWAGAAACTTRAPPVDTGASSGGPGTAAATESADAAASTALVAPPTTDPAIALGNLDAQLRGFAAVAARRPDDVDAAKQLVDLTLERGQFRGSVADYERADALAAALVKDHPESAIAHLARAETLGTFHLFSRALDELDAAERLHGPALAIAHARAADYMGQGRFDEAEALGLFRVTDGLDATDLASAAVLAGERGKRAESERLFEKARGAYHDVSPFAVAWVDFQRGSLLERKGERARAKPYYAEAHAALPAFPHACVHLAALEAPEQARVLLEPCVGKTDDPEVDAAYADALRRLGRADEAKPIIDRAKVRYDELIAKHPEAFADHAASFYLGIGGDPARALDLAKTNAANRHTEAALDLLMTAAFVAGARDIGCAAAAEGLKLRYATDAQRATFDSARRGCADSTGLRR